MMATATISTSTENKKTPQRATMGEFFVGDFLNQPKARINAKGCNKDTMYNLIRRIVFLKVFVRARDNFINYGLNNEYKCTHKWREIKE